MKDRSKRKEQRDCVVEKEKSNLLSVLYTVKGKGSGAKPCDILI